MQLTGLFVITIHLSLSFGALEKTTLPAKALPLNAYRSQPIPTARLLIALTSTGRAMAWGVTPACAY